RADRRNADRQPRRQPARREREPADPEPLGRDRALRGAPGAARPRVAGGGEANAIGGGERWTVRAKRAVRRRRLCFWEPGLGEERSDLVQQRFLEVDSP